MAIGVSLIDMYVRGLDGEAAPIGRHGIARVHREIEDGGLQLVRIRFDAPDARATDRFERDSLAQGPLRQVGHARDQHVDVEGLGIEQLPP
jgi:hypothetical protein